MRRNSITEKPTQLINSVLPETSDQEYSDKDQVEI